MSDQLKNANADIMFITDTIPRLEAAAAEAAKKAAEDAAAKGTGGAGTTLPSITFASHEGDVATLRLPGYGMPRADGERRARARARRGS